MKQQKLTTMTTSTILNKDFDVKIIHVGLMVNDNLWQHDKWLVVINGQSFDYHTGIGTRKIVREGGKNWHGYKNEATYYLNGSFKQERQNLENVNAKLDYFTKPTPPSIDDILYSLVLDSEAGDMTFNEWCDNLGYDNDSRKAESIYHACKETATKVNKFVDDLEEARELFQDY